MSKEQYKMDLPKADIAGPFGKSSIETGGTKNVLGGTSMAQQKEGKVDMGSAKGSLSMDKFKNVPQSSPDSKA